MYTLRETITRNDKIISQKNIFKGSFEEVQAYMEEKANADMEANLGGSCEIKHTEGSYSRIEAETLEGYYLTIMVREE